MAGDSHETDDEDGGDEKDTLEDDLSKLLQEALEDHGQSHPDLVAALMEAEDHDHDDERDDDAEEEEVERPRETFPQFLTRLNVEDASNTGARFDARCLDAPTFRVGYIFRFQAIGGLKATCQNFGHSDCSCWVTPRCRLKADDELWRALIERILDGRGHSVQEHRASTTLVKRRFGMHV